VTAANQPEGHSRIQVAAGNVHRGGDKGGNCQAVSQRDREHIVSRCFDRADADKNERERSDEFCQARTKLFHRFIQSKGFDDDNSIATALWAVFFGN
jgi:hypothetical protein